ncbi:hypothetical protein [Clostridium botulinum]|uniref:Uncharacterized protein n=1 Tax=Clostridium botulinum TaxID=1491 RepID=A0A9Q1UX41_CLOBO|nr:hypothetical protein [Clostridium botulinum]AEB76364.1 hypothetical protein CbC4_1688 [Clostridium botulinum BKT015925]KEI01220.1 hypothetical protein Z953_08905 [Clostridium botulinum D str. 16868]KEI04832.1 hypothetical protein Y848_11865 [Clostridium botulinum C/D str. Sp77]KLU75909.1 hypothetical protein CBC3_06225 [Clostridium botulinum V891]KOA75649.1 hypothetical protein ADU77_10900 [Clostridium botulinum]
MITNDNNLIISSSFQASNTPAGFVTVINKGAYVAFFTLSFQVGTKLYNEHSPNIAYGKSYRILYASDARELKLSAYYYNAIGDTKLICKKASYTPFNRCFSLGGTILKPTCSEVACPPDNSIPPELPPQNPCCCCCCCCCSKMFN